MMCRRKYFYKKILGLKSLTGKVSANYGTCIHAGVGAFYMSQELPLQERTAKAIAAFTEEWERYGQQGDEKRSLIGGVTTLTEYCKAYGKDTATFLPTLIEASQSIEMPNGTVLIVRIDRVTKDAVSDTTTIFDTKTCSMAFTDYYFRQYENNFQQSAYWYVVDSILGGTVDCSIIDLIKVPFSTGKSRSTGRPVENFVRRSYLRSDLQLEEFLNTYKRLTEEILANAASEDAAKFPQCPTACGNYGGCEYLPVCKYGYSHPAVRIDFVIEKEAECEGQD